MVNQCGERIIIIIILFENLNGTKSEDSCTDEKEEYLQKRKNQCCVLCCILVSMYLHMCVNAMQFCIVSMYWCGVLVVKNLEILYNIETWFHILICAPFFLFPKKIGPILEVSAIPGQPVAKFEHSSDSSPTCKNWFNILTINNGRIRY